MKKQEISFETNSWLAKEIENPLEVIAAFFQHAEIDHYKKTLSEAFFYMNKDHGKQEFPPGQLFMCYLAVRSLLRAAVSLQKNSKKWKLKNRSLKSNSELHKGSLTAAEYKDPFVVFRNAFAEKSVQEFEFFLCEIVEMALANYVSHFDADMITYFIHVVKILDAAQVLQEVCVQKIRKKERKACKGVPISTEEKVIASSEVPSIVNVSNQENYNELESEAPGVEVEQQEDKNQITTIITTTLSSCGIYCFGERKTKDAQKSVYSETKNSNTTHYYLLVIVQTMTQNATGELANIIKMETKGRYTATLLIHTLRDLRRNKTKQGYFFQQVIVEGVTWFENWEKTGPLKFASVSKRTFKEIERYWLDRKIAVDAFIDAALALNNNAAPLQLSFFHQAVEHLCLGLIHTFLGYRPHYFALGYLFDLCELFTPITSQFFPRKTKEELAIFKTFFRPFSDLHHMKIGEKELPHLSLIEVHCMEFYEQAIRIMEVELERLKSVE